MKIQELICIKCGNRIFPVIYDLETDKLFGYCEECELIYHKGEFNPNFIELIKLFREIKNPE
ncbi:MAG: hypothetical protein ACFE9I_13525 [Candidatus Hermodarchaeota archaeon]